MEVKPTINFATVSELPDILDLMNWAIVNTTAIYDYDLRDQQWIENWYEQKQQQGFPIMVILVNNQFVGFGSYGTFRAWQGFHRTMEHSIYLKPEHQGKGFGRILLSALVNEAKKNGVHALIGGIDGANEGSIILHEKLGFNEVGRLPQVGFKFDNYLDLVFLQRLL